MHSTFIYFSVVAIVILFSTRGTADPEIWSMCLVDEPMVRSYHLQDCDWTPKKQPRLPRTTFYSRTDEWELLTNGRAEWQSTVNKILKGRDINTLKKTEADEKIKSNVNCFYLFFCIKFLYIYFLFFFDLFIGSLCLYFVIIIFSSKHNMLTRFTEVYIIPSFN